MKYEDALRYMLDKLPMFSRIGDAAIKKDLHNTLALCRALQHPERKFPIIHVAGTNGKGSVSHMIASVLQAAGFRTGLYTSPHLEDFRERIRINGDMIGQSFVTDFIETHMELIEEVNPSFFEITVAMAFDAFAKEKVEIAVIETGLGGRLDSTNVVMPIVSVITNIGFDHMNLLGHTLPEIAFEKAGIIKTNIPVVIGEQKEETRRVFEQKAKITNSQLIFSEEEYKILSQEKGERLKITLENKYGSKEVYELDLTGHYQQKNLITVLSTLNILWQERWNIPTEAVTLGLQTVQASTGLKGRWEILRKKPHVIIDVGHNPDGVRQILLELERSSYKRLHLIIGMAKDKDVEGVLSLLPVAANYYFTKASIPRAIDENSLMQMAEPFRLKGQSYPNVNKALEHALSLAHQEDLILVCGSVFVAGEIDRDLKALHQKS